jgi:hypothetical protein
MKTAADTYLPCEFHTTLSKFMADMRLVQVAIGLTVLDVDTNETLSNLIAKFEICGFKLVVRNTIRQTTAKYKMPCNLIVNRWSQTANAVVESKYNAENVEQCMYCAAQHEPVALVEYSCT